MWMERARMPTYTGMHYYNVSTVCCVVVFTFSFIYTVESKVKQGKAKRKQTLQLTTINGSHSVTKRKGKCLLCVIGEIYGLELHFFNARRFVHVALPSRSNAQITWNMRYTRFQIECTLFVAPCARARARAPRPRHSNWIFISLSFATQNMY